ncbi:MAG: hypothetical protein Q4A79_01935 [Candidatus Saccharibacteria bacterium]|nr:hypothetical protein [Candidatus Saccharibacteria bacterium]
MKIEDLLEKGLKVSGNKKLRVEESAYGDAYIIKDGNGAVLGRIERSALK